MSVSNPTKEEKKLLADAEAWWSSLPAITKRNLCMQKFHSADYLMLSPYNIYVIWKG